MADLAKNIRETGKLGPEESQDEPPSTIFWCANHEHNFRIFIMI